MKFRAGFTLVEMLSMLAVAGILASLAAAEVGRSVEKASAVKCVSNLRQWGLAPQLLSWPADGSRWLLCYQFQTELGLLLGRHEAAESLGSRSQTHLLRFCL